MGVSLLQAVASLMSTCMRRLQRMARRMGSSGGGKGPSSSSRAVVSWKKALSLPMAKGKGAGREEEDGVWRKEILMGEQCQPLDFPEVIYDDVNGCRLALPPPTRSPMRSLIELDALGVAYSWPVAWTGVVATLPGASSSPSAAALARSLWPPPPAGAAPDRFARPSAARAHLWLGSLLPFY